MSLTNRSVFLGLNYEHGIDFSEYTGYWPMPETCGGVVKVFDEHNNPHVLVLDYSDGCFYDITLRDGSLGSNIINGFMDKTDTDGTGGYDIEPEVKFKEDTGEYEKFIIEHDSSRFYVRPDKETNRNIDGYDANGFLLGTEFTSELYVDGEPSTNSALSRNIPRNGEILYDRKVEGNRIHTVFKSNRSGFKLIGRQQDYIVKDVNYNPEKRVLNEGECQRIISNIYRRITRSSPTTERLTRYVVGTDGFQSLDGIPTDITASITTSIATGPDGNNSAVSISGGFTGLCRLPDITTPVRYLTLVWLRSSLPVDVLNLFSLSPWEDPLQLSGTGFIVNDYELYYGFWDMDSTNSEDLLTIRADNEISIFDFRLVKTDDLFYNGNDIVNVTDVTEYVYRDVSENNADNVCPMYY